MAFKIWQIGLHLQQQEAVAVAIVRGAKECFLQRWWRLPLENDIIKDGRIVDAQQLAKTLLPWSRELPQRHHISFPPVAHYSGHFRARRCPLVSGSKRPGCQGRWPASWIWIRTPCASITAKTHSVPPIT